MLVGLLVFLKFTQISLLMAKGKEAAAAGPPPEPVGSAVTQSASWEETLPAVGTVAGVRSVQISNESPGRVKRIRFESGAVVKKGQPLVELDTSVERAQLGAARSRRDLAVITAQRSRALFEREVVAQAEIDRDEANLKGTERDVAALEAEIDRKVVRAPFSGRLGIREVDLGEYLNAGTRLTILETLGEMFVDFTLPQELLGSVAEGMPVRVSLEGASLPTIDGVVAAVDPAVDDVTRSLKLRATVANPQDRLRPGMFVSVSVVLPKAKPIVAVPATAVVYAPYGDSVFLLEDKKPGSPGMSKTPAGKPVKVARQQFVRLGEARGDFVAISEGLKAGQEVVSAGAFKLRNGSPVVVDNTIKQDAQLNPRPENR
ncbi:MAG TPA: efflux RND transporter periplasmic adaptor subunit [Polyangiaceae bacterium]|nr:efflux RND transporter periplasmic adaptor subunit [Polyangiaceae bacterium]